MRGNPWEKTRQTIHSHCNFLYCSLAERYQTAFRLHTSCLLALPVFPWSLTPPQHPPPHPPQWSADVSSMASGRWKLWKPPDWPCRRKRQTKGELRVVWSLLRGKRESERDGRDWGSCGAVAQLLPGGLAEGFWAREERSGLWGASERVKKREKEKHSFALGDWQHKLTELCRSHVLHPRPGWICVVPSHALVRRAPEGMAPPRANKRELKLWLKPCLS